MVTISDCSSNEESMSSDDSRFGQMMHMTQFHSVREPLQYLVKDEDSVEEPTHTFVNLCESDGQCEEETLK